jgi:beta-phosphoglucomutase-like phosphatase (HAD superfamily)/dTDP-glucose pyrophosphorylase
MNNYKLFIFDLDGVLIDSKENHFHSLNKSLELIDKKYCISKNEQKYTFEGLTTNQKLILLSKIKNLPSHYYDVIWKNKQKFSTKLFNKITKNKQLIEVFNFIKTNNIKIAVASNSVKSTVELVLNKLGIMDYVDLYLSNEDVTSPKPSPEIYNKCFEILNIKKNDSLIFEDSFFGKISALKSECKIYSINNPSEVNMKNIKSIIEKKQKIKVLIPMAGEGSRFKDFGYKDIKPMIKVNNKTMVEIVIKNIGIEAEYIFIVRKEDEVLYGISEHISKYVNNSKIIIQDEKLPGAASSSLLARELIDNDDHLVIANIDQYIDDDINFIIGNFISKGVDGGILTFENSDPKWSYVKTNDFGTIDAVAEKNVISNEATCGVYFWNKGSDYVKYATKMIEKNIKTNNEFYICPAYNEAISDHKLIVSYKVKEMHGMGTPDDLEIFLQKNILV